MTEQPEQLDLDFDPNEVIDLNPKKEEPKQPKQPQPDASKLYEPDDPYAGLGGGLPSRRKKPK